MVAGSAAAAMVVAVASVGVVEALRTSAADNSSIVGPASTPSDWTSLEVPWVDHNQIQFGDAAILRPTGRGPIAAAEGAAIVADDTGDGSGGETRQVSALYADGTTAVLGNGLVGIPLADPGGVLAAWTTSIPAGDTTVNVFDTESREVIASTTVGADIRVLSVHGDTLLLGNLDDVELTWSPTSGGDPQPLSVARTVDDGFISDTAGDVAFATRLGASELVRTDGTTVAAFDDLYFASISPSSRFVALSGQRNIRVWDATADQEVQLGLPADQRGEATRWSPDGVLVVRTVPTETGTPIPPDTPVTYFACQVPSGACQSLPSVTESAGLADGLESSSAGQFATYVG